MQTIDFSTPRHLRIPLRATVKHASAERRTQDSVLVAVRRAGHTGLGEGCPRPYVTGETGEEAVEWIQGLTGELESTVDCLGSLEDWADDQAAAIDRHPAAWAAVEIACLDLFAREGGVSIERLLGLPDSEREYRYTAVLGAEDGRVFQDMVGRYLKFGFSTFKIRPTGDPEVDRRRIDTLRSMASGAGVDAPTFRIDGNNLWAGRAGDCASYLEALDCPLEALEEPLAPRDYAALAELGRSFDLPIILDESAGSPEDLERAAQIDARWVVNIKVAKVGGLRRSLQLARRARNLDWPVIVGAHVGETSILTRAALPVARAAGDALFAQEGAFGTLLLEHEPVRPSISFGPGGLLKYPPGSPEPGLGLELVEDDLIRHPTTPTS